MQRQEGSRNLLRNSGPGLRRANGKRNLFAKPNVCPPGSVQISDGRCFQKNSSTAKANVQCGYVTEAGTNARKECIAAELAAYGGARRKTRGRKSRRNRKSRHNRKSRRN